MKKDPRCSLVFLCLQFCHQELLRNQFLTNFGSVSLFLLLCNLMMLLIQYIKVIDIFSFLLRFSFVFLQSIVDMLFPFHLFSGLLMFLFLLVLPCPVSISLLSSFHFFIFLFINLNV